MFKEEVKNINEGEKIEVKNENETKAFITAIADMEILTTLASDTFLNLRLTLKNSRLNNNAEFERMMGRASARLNDIEEKLKELVFKEEIIRLCEEKGIDADYIIGVKEEEE